MKTRTSLSVRWMIRRDLPEVLAIDSLSHQAAWGEDEMLLRLRRRDCIGMIVEVGGFVAGFTVYTLHKDMLRVVRMAVDPAKRNRGVGLAMVEKLIEKLSLQRRATIIIEVDESNLTALCWLKRRGFAADGISRSEVGDDKIEMLFRLPKPAEQEPSSRFWAYNPITEEFVGGIE